ncbi:hypothetical protein RFI_19814, partial [Reticulomyxa filosa]
FFFFLKKKKKKKKVHQGAVSEEITEIQQKTKLLQQKVRTHHNSAVNFQLQCVSPTLAQSDRFSNVMGQFLQTAVLKLQTLRTEYDHAVQETHFVLKYFGESESLRWEQLFEIVQKFILAFDVTYMQLVFVCFFFTLYTILQQKARMDYQDFVEKEMRGLLCCDTKKNQSINSPMPKQTKKKENEKNDTKIKDSHELDGSTTSTVDNTHDKNEITEMMW